MSGYSKLFSEIIMSTVWREPDHVRILWITMLAIKDRWHKVHASIPGLADAARITIEQCQDALNILSSPDPYSRSKEYEGRRIEEVDGGWIILNGEKYRDRMSLDERREYKRVKQKQYRERDKQNALTSCGQSSAQLTHTDSDTDTNQKEKPRSRARPSSAKEVEEYAASIDFIIDGQQFIDYYEQSGWILPGRRPVKDWKACVRTWKARGKSQQTNSDHGFEKLWEEAIAGISKFGRRECPVYSDPRIGPAIDAVFGGQYNLCGMSEQQIQFRRGQFINAIRNPK